MAAVTPARVVVIGADGPLGRRTAEALVASGVELVAGTSTGGGPLPSGVQRVDVVGEHRAVAELLIDRRIDTIVHAGWWGRRPGRRGIHDHIITSMWWTSAAAAAHREAAVRSFVMTSPAAVYPAASNAPRLHPEQEVLQPAPGSVAASVLEAEQFGRDLAVTSPHLAVAILRLGDLIGGPPSDDLATLLAGPMVPAVWGFDPEVQFLHIGDAAAAVEHAARELLAGVYNVAGAGTVRWREAIRRQGKATLELPPVPPRVLAPFLMFSELGRSDDLVDVLRFGRCMDTDAIGFTGFVPSRPTEDCLVS